MRPTRVHLLHLLSVSLRASCAAPGGGPSRESVNPVAFGLGFQSEWMRANR